MDINTLRDINDTKSKLINRAEANGGFTEDTLNAVKELLRKEQSFIANIDRGE